MYNSITMKKNITYLILIIFTLILILLGLFNPSKNSQILSTTFAPSTSYTGYDFDFDGKIDDISFISTKSSYSLKIKNSLGESLFRSNTYDYLLLDISSSCTPNIYFVDLTRNKIPEIIVSGLKNNAPAFYIFRWMGSGFEEILFSSSNIFGILDYNNSRTSKVLTSSSEKGDESTKGSIITNKKVKDITFSQPKIYSLSPIQKLIDLIQLDYEIDDAPGIFTPYIPSEELALLWNLDKLTYHYTFQKAYFYDTTWDAEGKPTSLFWILSFEKSNFSDSNSKPSEMILYVKSELDELDEYKISSIIKK